MSTPTSAAGAIDCDVHPHFRDGIRDLAPYADEPSRVRMGLAELPYAWAKGLPSGEVRIPVNPFVNPGGTLRPDTVPPNGGPPASDPEYTKIDLLDRYNLGAAILIGGNILGLGGFADGDLPTAFASAYNRWLDEVWLQHDPRYLGSILVAPHDAAKAVAEIERWGDNPRMVQVYIPDRQGLPLGKRHFYPIYEAATHYKLPIATHPGGASAGFNGSMVAGGDPSYYFDFHSSLSQVAQTHVITLVTEGVFERFPTIRFVLTESGFAWMPHLMWRMDNNWKALRRDVPWLKRLPSEYLLEHLRVTTQPLYEPADRRHLGMLLELMHADRTLMFSTDYPHWDTDDPDHAWRKLPNDYRHKIMHETPRKFYADRLALAGIEPDLVGSQT
jgi:predicted TIM-barrel fold metal-dependent hydrolase